MNAECPSEGALMINFVADLRDKVVEAERLRDVEMMVALIKIAIEFTNFYIEEVHIMHPDPKIRYSRLSFLNFIVKEILGRVGDFTKIQKI